MDWVRAHWQAIGIAVALFLAGLGIGVVVSGSGGDESAAGGSAETVTEAATETTEAEPVTETVTKTVTTTVEPAPESVIPGDGTFLVGRDFEPGTYRTEGASGRNCYWARLSGTSGESKDIIASGNVTGPTTVTIASSDTAFETKGCQEWKLR